MTIWKQGKPTPGKRQRERMKSLGRLNNPHPNSTLGSVDQQALADYKRAQEQAAILDAIRRPPATE